MMTYFHYTATQIWLNAAYWWVMGALCGIGIGKWIYKKLGRLK